MTHPEPNDILREATLMSGNTTTMGMVQGHGDWAGLVQVHGERGRPDHRDGELGADTSAEDFLVDLMDDGNNWLAGIPLAPVSPKEITYTAKYGGTYYVHVMSPNGSRIGYMLTVKIGIGSGTCADPVAGGFSPATNDLGEMVWSQFDWGTSDQIYSSSTHSFLTNDAACMNRRY